MTFEIDISNRQNIVAVDCNSLHAALQRTLELEHVASAILSVSIVDNETIHVLNREHLSHDYPTDVISFQLDFHDATEDPSDAFAFDELECEDFEAEEDHDADESGAEPVDGGSAGPDQADLETSLVSPVNKSEELPGHTADQKSERSQKGPASGAFIEGEIIASAEMAATMAADGRWSAQAELTLYVVHGLLHVCGYDDLTPEVQSVMRGRERTILKSLGLNAVYSED